LKSEQISKVSAEKVIKIDIFSKKLSVCTGRENGRESVEMRMDIHSVFKAACMDVRRLCMDIR